MTTARDNQLSEKLAEGNENTEANVAMAALLEYPVPSYKRISLDIEVDHRSRPPRVPDPNIADDRVICATLLPKRP